MSKRAKKADSVVDRAVAANIRRLAKARGVGLNVIADLAGVSRSQLFDVLAANTSPTIDWLALVAQALGVEISDLMRPASDDADERTTA